MPGPSIDLTSEHRHLVSEILRHCLPVETRVWVFGSRATGRARRYSDLDLAIDAARPLTIDQLAALREAFEESDLPFMVDLVDWRCVDQGFRASMCDARVPLLVPQEPPTP